MPRIRSLTMLSPMVAMTAALALGGCGTTYGTGETAASQTIKDVTGILSLGGSKSDEPPINYEPRAPIVEPPTGGLPPPGSANTNTVAAAGNWPVDPDQERERVEALVKEANESGQSLKFTVPDVERAPRTPVSSRAKRQDSAALAALDRSRETKNNPDADKMFANAKKAKTGSFDENGNPVRKYLTEPPSEYRVPDSESAIEITEKPKKRQFKMPDLWPF